ncbi:hypothetical protein [Bosea sp. RAC05]|uniref:hypothetical protein n=1 Tax=Bosea sp. RAC05 TaxID=1842539 RepID=UPI000858CA22|nr:hypothetical protein [Bosea sp. RAC05]AOG03366.1 hypothetical protein BSY19_4764 [Bosea sp. RAC05]
MTTITSVSLVEKMKSCEQMPGLSVLDHGIMVRDYYKDLIGHIREGNPLQFSWRLPEWITDPRLKQRLLCDELMATYQVYHDCGKPFCLVIGEDGKRHFPNHAQVSKDTWLSLGGDPRVADLIGMDMDAHLLKDDGVAAFAQRPQAVALLLTALAEVHANATMFGGIESISFKQKWKTLDRRGKAVLRHYPED